MVDRTLGLIKKRSVSGARTAKIVISGTMRYAARQGAVAVNSVRAVERIDSPPRRQPRALSAEERRAWLDLGEASEKALTWDLPDLTRMLATGCRIGECLAIDAATVDVHWRLVRRTGVGLLRYRPPSPAARASV